MAANRYRPGRQIRSATHAGSPLADARSVPWFAGRRSAAVVAVIPRSPRLAPLDRMTERARTINAERLQDRLPVDNPQDELGRLATVFNDTPVGSNPLRTDAAITSMHRTSCVLH